MEIQGIQSASSFGNSVQKAGADSASGQLSQTVAQMKTGGGTGDASGDEDTVTVQRTLSDGSIILLTMKGQEVVSETKIRTPQPKENPLMAEGPLANPAAAGLSALTDRFNDTSTSISAGAIFSQRV